MTYIESDACYCDYDPPAFYTRKMVKAQKSHKCEECGRVIRAGEAYEYVFGKWDGYIDEFKTCLHCNDIRAFMTNSLPCFCWAHGSLDEDVRNAVEAAYSRAGDEVRGLAFGVGRLMVARKREASKRWKA